MVNAFISVNEGKSENVYSLVYYSMEVQYPAEFYLAQFFVSCNFISISVEI